MDRVAERLKLDEGYSPTVYKDSLGFDTIGYGFLVDFRGGGLDDVEADFILAHRIEKATLAAMQYPWYVKLDSVRQDVIRMMLYQMGPGTFSQFHMFHTALDTGDWKEAATQMLASKWAEQTPARAKREASIMLNGVWV